MRRVMETGSSSSSDEEDEKGDTARESHVALIAAACTATIAAASIAPSPLSDEAMSSMDTGTLREAVRARDRAIAELRTALRGQARHGLRRVVHKRHMAACELLTVRRHLKPRRT